VIHYFLSPLQSEFLRPSSFLIQYGASLITCVVFSTHGQRRDSHIVEPDPIPTTMSTDPKPALSSPGHLEYAQLYRVIISVRIPYVTYFLATPFLFPHQFPSLISPIFFFPPSTLNACKWFRTRYDIDRTISASYLNKGDGGRLIRTL